jgi:hypothetical protein
MSRVPPNQTFQGQQKTLVRATFKKAFVNAVHAGSRTVDVYFAESPQTIIRNIPVATQIGISTIMVGSRCRVDVFDETNSSDMVMSYTY